MSSLLSTAKSVAQLAAKQAEKTKLTTITLPAQYQPLGKHCYELQQHRTEFSDLFQKLDAIRSQLANIAKSSEGKPTPQSLGDKAKATAGKAMNAAQSQKLSMQQASLFGALGKAVYEAHGNNSGPSNLTTPIAASLSRLAVLDADISRLSSEGKGSWITPKRLAIAGAVAACLFVVAVMKEVQKGRDNGRTAVAQSRDGTSVETIEPASSESTPIVEIAATDLYAAFQNNPEAADKQYKGKWLAVTGAVGTRDNSPKNHPGTTLMGLEGASEKDSYVACYFIKQNEPMLRLLDSTPQPPIIGKCAGAAQSEYGKADHPLIEVQLMECRISGPTMRTPDSPVTQAQSIFGHRVPVVNDGNASVATSSGTVTLTKAFFPMEVGKEREVVHRLYLLTDEPVPPVDKQGTLVFTPYIRDPNANAVSLRLRFETTDKFHPNKDDWINHDFVDHSDFRFTSRGVESLIYNLAGVWGTVFPFGSKVGDQWIAHGSPDVAIAWLYRFVRVEQNSGTPCAVVEAVYITGSGGPLRYCQWYLMENVGIVRWDYFGRGWDWNTKDHKDEWVPKAQILTNDWKGSKSPIGPLEWKK